MTDLSSLVTDVWDTFYDIISNNVSDPKNRGIKWIHTEFPDADIKSPSDYPRLTIASPEVNHRRLGIKGTNAELSVDIGIYVTRKETLDSLSDSIINAINSNLNTFRQNFIYHVNLTGSTTASIDRGSFKEHQKILTYNIVHFFRRG